MTVKEPFTLPATNAIEQSAELWAEFYHNAVEPGHGLFLDFKKCPELEQPDINCLVSKYGWALEKPCFIRKPV